MVADRRLRVRTGIMVTLYSTPIPLASRFGSAAPGARVAAGRGGEAVEKGLRTERAGDRFRRPERRGGLGGERRGSTHQI